MFLILPNFTYLFTFGGRKWFVDLSLNGLDWHALTGEGAIPLRDRIISQVVYNNQLIDYNIDLIELSDGCMLTSVFDHWKTASGRARADWMGTG
jgi:hypothetical protein